MSLSFSKVRIMDEKKHAKAFKQGIRAFVDLIVNGWRQNGYRIMDHGNGLWVSPPTTRSEYKGKNYFHPVVEHEKASVNETLHDDIIAKFKQVKAGDAVSDKKEEPAEKVY